MKKRTRPYLGINAAKGVREVFRSENKPTAETHSQYAAVVGPFDTMRGACFMRDHGQNNPNCQTVTQAEKLAKAAAQANTMELEVGGVAKLSGAMGRAFVDGLASKTTSMYRGE